MMMTMTRVSQLLDFIETWGFLEDVNDVIAVAADKNNINNNDDDNDNNDVKVI